MLLFRASARDLALKIRYALKNKNPLVAAKDNVVRQRSAVLREDRDRCTLKNKDPLIAVKYG